MKTLKFVAIAFIALGVSYTAKADKPYGMAGCGVWTYVIKDKTMGAQLGVWALRSLVLNVQTFAITSGTSNCVAGRGSQAKSEEREVFVAANLTELSKEAAQGNGAHLNGLATVLGCQDAETFAKVSQKQYTEIFGSNDPKTVLDNYLNEVRSNEALATSCNVG